jgi:2-polyprenyl-3-methyl-5-hydroxy-6-metoxy-1,4-benzoquinol methylase
VWGFDPNSSSSNPYIVNRREEISASFDGIFSNNVIEHFRTPVTQFEEFHRILKPGGMMAHSSPCYEYAYGIAL